MNRKDYIVVRYIDKGRFGQVYQVKNPDEVSFALTPFYAAPEWFTHHYDMVVDRWSAAVIYFQILSGGLPFSGDDPTQILGAIGEASPDYSAVPEERGAFLQKCAACGDSFKEGIVKDNVFYCHRHYEKLFSTGVPLENAEPDHLREDRVGSRGRYALSGERQFEKQKPLGYEQ
jgi:serine/threonine protein kinase